MPELNETLEQAQKQADQEYRNGNIEKANEILRNALTDAEAKYNQMRQVKG